MLSLTSKEAFRKSGATTMNALKKDDFFDHKPATRIFSRAGTVIEAIIDVFNNKLEYEVFPNHQDGGADTLFNAIQMAKSIDDDLHDLCCDDFRVADGSGYCVEHQIAYISGVKLTVSGNVVTRKLTFVVENRNGGTGSVSTLEAALVLFNSQL